MSLVVGTAGHIDHGKTTLLRALTGIDADRLPEERRRGMTIDVGYAHITLEDGAVIDFVDVPGHDRLVGNMLVGAGEIDATLLVVAADDGPRAQTREHLGLLDALGISAGVVAITKTDAVDALRLAEVRQAVRELLEPTSLAGAPTVDVSGVTGAGLEALRRELAILAASFQVTSRPPTLAIDRAFTVRGRGVVVTGTLRGGPLERGDHLRLVPGDRDVRIRELQVRGTAVERVADGGRTAMNLVGLELDDLRRGQVLTADPAVMATDRLLAVFRRPIEDGVRARFHAGTTSAGGTVARAGRDALTLPDGRVAGIVRLDEPAALRPGDPFVLRRGPGLEPVGGVVLDVAPPRGLSRRRQRADRVAALAADPGTATRLALHGALVTGARVALADDVGADARATAIASADPSVAMTVLRSIVAVRLRRTVSIRRDDAITAAIGVVDELLATGALVRDGDRVRLPGAVPTDPGHDPALEAAMDRLVTALAVVAPPPLGEAAKRAGCPPGGIRELERAARIVVLETDLAYAMPTYRDLAAVALRLAGAAPLTPAAFRDATGTSRKYVMAILEDLDRRAILRRTPAGHVPGPKAPTSAGAIATR